MKAPKQFSDEELVLLYRNGDNSAFQALLLRYKASLFSNIFSVVRSRELAEDIFQDTFVKAIITIQQGRYTETGRFSGWLNRIAHNLIIDYFRRQKNENTFSADNADYDILNDARLSEISIDEVMSKEQMLNDLVALVDFLPQTQREVLQMRIFEDLSFKEIADKTGVSINTSLGRMRYALINMRKFAAEKNL
ncbi:MAG: sigma-70 family RNA polymerase sigma factor [Prevotellaceae bacterium]|jgi:RNA polymerase sigma-70 factor (ECF subfamily)|nr:sigma-70 family RNA polymerase sigma factor [Prevotellaceae bacterium]